MFKSLLFTYGLTYGGAVISLFRPWIGFLIYVCFAIIKPDSLWFWSVPEGNYSRVIALALLAGWAINGFGDWNLGRAKGVVVCLVGFWVVLLGAAAAAPDQGIAWPPVESMSKIFLPILVGISLIDSWAKLRQLAWVIGLSQGFLAYEFNLTYYTTEFNYRDFLHAGLDNNGIAITMVSSIGVTFFLGMHAKAWWAKLIAFGGAGLMAHVVLFSSSRGGMLSLIVTGLGCFLLIPKRPSSYLIFLLMVLVVGRLAGEGVQHRFGTIFEEKGSSEEADGGGKRLDHWKACCQSMVEHPLGVGPDHWPMTAPKYGLPVMAAHSNWLQMGAELGIPGVAFLLGYYLLSLWRLWPYTRDRQPAPDPWARYLARMVIASAIGFLVSAQFVTVNAVELPYYIVLIGAGVLKLSSAATAEDEAEEEGDAEEEEEAEGRRLAGVSAGGAQR